MAQAGGVNRHGGHHPFRPAKRQFRNEFRIACVAKISIEPEVLPAPHGLRIEIHPQHPDAPLLQPQPDGGAKAAQTEDDDIVAASFTRARLERFARGSLAFEDAEQGFEHGVKLMRR